MLQGMRKSKKKLTLKRQAIRVLSGLDLTHAIGGQDGAVVLDTEATCGPTTKPLIQAPTVGCGPG